MQLTEIVPLSWIKWNNIYKTINNPNTEMETLLHKLNRLVADLVKVRNGALEKPHLTDLQD